MKSEKVWCAAVRHGSNVLKRVSYRQVRREYLMKKDLRTIPLGVLVATLVLVHDFWDGDFNTWNIIMAPVTFILVVMITQVITEAIISSAEKDSSIKSIIKISIIIVGVILVLAFLIRTRIPTDVI